MIDATTEAVDRHIRAFAKRGWGVDDIWTWLIVNLGVEADRQHIRDIVWGVK